MLGGEKNVNVFIFHHFLLLCSIFNYRTRAWTTRPAFPGFSQHSSSTFHDRDALWFPSNLHLKSILSPKIFVILYSLLIYLTLTDSPAVYKQTRKMVIMNKSHFHLHVFIWMSDQYLHNPDVI